MGKALRNTAVEILRPQQKPLRPQDDRRLGWCKPAAGKRQVGAREEPLGAASDSRRARLREARAPERQLGDLISIGPAMLRDFEMLGIRSVGQLARQDPQKMYETLGRKMGQRQDPCVLDTFCAAVAQARNPRLPAGQCQWWWWSRKRK